MDIQQFKTKYIDKFNKFKILYHFYKDNGASSFGDLNRIEFENDNKSGVLDFWSNGPFGLEVYDFSLEEPAIMVLLLTNEEKHMEEKAVENFISLLLNNTTLHKDIPLIRGGKLTS